MLPLEPFLTGYRQTALQPDELLTAVLIRAQLRGRRPLGVPEAGSAPLPGDLGGDGGGRGVDGSATSIVEARVAVGACSPVAQRLRSLESALVGRSTRRRRRRNDPDHLAALSPIDDVRATADYRRWAAAELVRRALQRCGGDG